MNRYQILCLKSERLDTFRNLIKRRKGQREDGFRHTRRLVSSLRVTSWHGECSYSIHTNDGEATYTGLPLVVHYIDDVLVYSQTWDEHVDDLRRVFQRLRESNLTPRPNK